MMSEFLDSSWDRVRLVTLDTLADNLIVPANGEVLSDTLQGGVPIPRSIHVILQRNTRGTQDTDRVPPIRNWFHAVTNLDIIALPRILLTIIVKI